MVFVTKSHSEFIYHFYLTFWYFFNYCDVFIIDVHAFITRNYWTLFQLLYILLMF